MKRYFFLPLFFVLACGSDPKAVPVFVTNQLDPLTCSVAPCPDCICAPALEPVLCPTAEPVVITRDLCNELFPRRGPKDK